MNNAGEENPFQSPNASRVHVGPRHWWVLWAVSGLLTVITVVSAVSDSLSLLSFLIPLIGVPSLLRTTIDLARKQAAGWVIAAAVQWKSLGASLLITGAVYLSCGIAGFTLCYAAVQGVVATATTPPYFEMMVVVCVSGLLIVVAVGVMFYMLGPRKAADWKRGSTDGQPNGQGDSGESENT